MYSILRTVAGPTAVLTALLFATSAASAQEPIGYVSYPSAPAPDYPGSTSYWNHTGAWGASLYPAPLPVPVNVGQTFYTYEPLYPHHYLNAHANVYLQSPITIRKYHGCPRLHGQNASAVIVRYSIFPWF